MFKHYIAVHDNNIFNNFFHYSEVTNYSKVEPNGTEHIFETNVDSIIYFQL